MVTGFPLGFSPYKYRSNDQRGIPVACEMVLIRQRGIVGESNSSKMRDFSVGIVGSFWLAPVVVNQLHKCALFLVLLPMLHTGVSGHCQVAP